MPTLAHNYTIKTTSNGKTFYIRMLEHAKLSNFRFGGTFIGATDYSQTSTQNSISTQFLIRLSKILEKRKILDRKKGSGLTQLGSAHVAAGEGRSRPGWLGLAGWPAGL